MKLINLLPKVRQQELVYEALLGRLIFVIWISVFSFAIVFATQYAAKLYLQKELQLVQLEVETVTKQNNKQDNAEIKNAIQQINNQILDYKNLIETSPKWSKVLKAFVKLPPEGIRVNSFSIDELTKRLSISGFSPTRELVLEFYKNIEADSKNFSGLEKYLENISKPTDINFHMVFNINPELLK